MAQNNNGPIPIFFLIKDFRINDHLFLMQEKKCRRSRFKRIQNIVCERDSHQGAGRSFAGQNSSLSISGFISTVFPRYLKYETSNQSLSGIG
ncbi:hypothetical protein AALP_AA8G497700 [Arabis alpina]|uniref:Uncharacterized protein n=1 Tax=Arabis alpina TaxID=50452 RepID=A0A087GEJ3_ARAAL|nr:hypothetical protein AALP_AA8G497700 [Arabis alpina]